jgi:hypothetical protein
MIVCGVQFVAGFPVYRSRSRLCATKIFQPKGNDLQNAGDQQVLSGFSARDAQHGARSTNDRRNECAATLTTVVIRVLPKQHRRITFFPRR